MVEVIESSKWEALSSSFITAIIKYEIQIQSHN
jgi:hypothetical protein